MIEIPEAVSLAKQLNDTVTGMKISSAAAGLSPHKFAWYHGDPQDYDTLLCGKTVGKAVAQGGLLEVHADDVICLFSDGVSLRLHNTDEQLPKKYQMRVEFEDGTHLSASVQMYGGLWCFREGGFDDNAYYTAARAKPSPLTDEFNKEYFYRLISAPEIRKLSAKAFLATEQRIPGLGNGVLQDILYNARIHPRRKMETLADDNREALFNSVKSTLQEMTSLGGRDTEKDLFGDPGGYKTRASQNTAGTDCPVCGSMIIKQPYMGGSIYFCEGCQKL